MESAATAPIKKKQQYSVVKSAIYFAFGTLMSRVLGLVRDRLINNTFGPTVTDSFYLAYRFPNLFRRIFGEGALSACFIPLYIEYKEKNDRKSLGQLTAGILGVLMLVLLPFSIAISFSLDWIIPLWVGGDGFAQIPGKIDMTLTMTKIMFPFLILVSLYAYFMALLNANRKFLLSSIASSLLNVAVIGACAYCYLTKNLSPFILSWSIILGGVLQFIILIPALRGLNIPFEFSWASITSLPVKRTLIAFLPSILGLGIVQFMALINGTFASSLEEGSVSYIYLADRLLELPLSLITVSLGTAALPSLSEKLSQNNLEHFKSDMVGHIQLMLFLCIPAGVGMWMTSDLLVPVLFEGGKFTGEKALVVSEIVRIYAFTLVTASLSRIVSQAFYAAKLTKIPSYAALFGLVVHLMLAPALMSAYGVYGLVASTAFSSLLNCGYLFVAFSLRYGALSYGKLFLFISKCLAASLAIVGVCYIVLNAFHTTGMVSKIVALLVCVGFSMVGYLALGMVLKIKETDWFLRKIKSRM